MNMKDGWGDKMVNQRNFEIDEVKKACNFNKKFIPPPEDKSLDKKALGVVQLLIREIEFSLYPLSKDQSIIKMEVFNG